MDDGIRDTHEQFINNEIIHVLGEGHAYHRDWVQSHGTHVAATAGGIDYGVSKNLRIYDYRVCQYPDNPEHEYDAPCYTNLIIKSLQSITNKLKSTNGDRRGVINMSLGGRRSFFSTLWEYYFKFMIEYGGIPVVGAGNEAIDACYYTPAWSDYAITVGAADSHYKVMFLYCFSLSVWLADVNK